MDNESLEDINNEILSNDADIEDNMNNIVLNNEKIDKLTSLLSANESIKKDSEIKVVYAQYHYIAWALTFLLVSGLFIHKIMKK